MQPRLSSSTMGLRIHVGFSERCGEADYFTPKPKGGADSCTRALQGSSHSLATGWQCSCCFPSPNPEGEKRWVRIPQNHTGTWKNDTSPTATLR